MTRGPAHVVAHVVPHTGHAARTARLARGARLATAGAALVLGTSACDAPEPRPSDATTTAAPRRADALAAVPTTSAESSAVPASRLILVDACVREATAPGEGWTLAQVEPGLTRLDRRALSTLAPRDSARLAARLARTVDALPSDTTIADFRGLPVVVREAWSVVAAIGDTVVVAFVERRLPMESNPLEEAFTLVAVPGVRQGVREPLLEQWFVREVGREEALDPREFLAAFGGADGAAVLAFLRERDTGPSLEIVTRTAGRWAPAWSGPVARCG